MLGPWTGGRDTGWRPGCWRDLAPPPSIPSPVEAWLSQGPGGGGQGAAGGGWVEPGLQALIKSVN